MGGGGLCAGRDVLPCPYHHRRWLRLFGGVVAAMMDALVSLIPGGWLTAILAGLAAVGGAVWRAFVAGKTSQKNADRAKEADAYEQHLEDLAAANRARNSVTGSLPDNDPYRRD